MVDESNAEKSITASRRGLSFVLKNNYLLVIGILLILLSAVLLADASTKQGDCQSVPGKLVQLFDQSIKENCSGLRTILFLSYAGLTLGVGLMLINFITRKS